MVNIYRRGDERGWTIVEWVDEGWKGVPMYNSVHYVHGVHEMLYLN